MTVQARPEPKPLPGTHDTAHELLVTTQRVHNESRRLTALIDQQLRAANTPAQMQGPFRLTASKPILTAEAGRESPSFGIWNPNPVVIYLGMGGIARPGAEGLSVPANALLVFPLAVEDLDLGVDPADPLLTGAAVVTVLRFECVQAAFLGAL